MAARKKSGLIRNITLTGTLASGDTIGGTFTRQESATITLVAEPVFLPALQPAGLVGLAASILGFGLMALAAGRRRRAL